MQIDKRGAEIPMQRDAATTAFFSGVVAQLDAAADLASRTDHHVPRQVGYLTGPQAGLGRQQHDDAVTQGIAHAIGVHKEISNIR
jgi:hypothetical protein